MNRSQILTSAIAAMFLLIAGKAGADQPPVLIDVQHDSRRQVTCWITPQGGISCLPDSSLQPQVTTTPPNGAARASQADSIRQNEQLPTTSRPPQKGLQL